MAVNKTRKAVNQDYNAKRLARPKINVITNVPEESIQQLEALALVDGTKKKAILRAIQERYEKVCIEKNQVDDTNYEYPLYLNELFDE